MWMFKSLSGKDHTGLEGRVIEICNIKIRLQNAIAEGGFSSVYLAHDVMNASNQYALKHMICQDAESLDLVMKEIQVMKVLKGHPNVVNLIAHSILDIGRRKEALLLMEFCEKSLVNVLEMRGIEYLEESKVLLIFRDVCNAVFSMHSRSPPIAHRDLKAENVLLGSDGAWKLCDFGSTSTNHKCFDKPEEMGIEEDNIRKHTTPAYRAPEMWDLYKREVISEKVDIWALGCLLYRICYFKSAFDGESKLQILNGNYRIPELPKYSADVTGLIKEMLEGSPDARPDITQARALSDWPFISIRLGLLDMCICNGNIQVWFRVNELLPVELQKHLPDRAEVSSNVNTHSPISDACNEGTVNKNPVRPKRSPPPPPSLVEKGGEELKARLSHGSENGLGAFWSTQFAQDSQSAEGKARSFDEPMHNHSNIDRRTSPVEQRARNSNKINNYKGVDEGDTENTSTVQNQSFAPFMADFNSNKPNSKREQELEADVEKLKLQLKQLKLEKAEVTSKFEKLSIICRSQRQEIQELKLAQATSTPPSDKESSKRHGFISNTLSKEKGEVSASDPAKGMLSFETSPSADPKPWQAFSDEPKQNPTPYPKHSKSVRTSSDRLSSTKLTASSTTALDDWGFNQVSFTASGSSGSEPLRPPVRGSSSQRFAAVDVKKVESSQPGGWAGF